MDDWAENREVNTASQKLPTILTNKNQGSPEHERSSTAGTHAVTPLNCRKKPKSRKQKAGHPKENLLTKKCCFRESQSNSGLKGRYWFNLCTQSKVKYTRLLIPWKSARSLPLSEPLKTGKAVEKPRFTCNFINQPLKLTKHCCTLCYSCHPHLSKGLLQGNDVTKVFIQTCQIITRTLIKSKSQITQLHFLVSSKLQSAERTRKAA